MGRRSHLTKTGTPTMGGALILICDRHHDVAVGRSVEPLRLGRAARHARLRLDRLGRRLPQSRARNPKGMRAREKYFWQSADRHWLRRSTSRSRSPRRRPIASGTLLHLLGHAAAFTLDLPAALRPDRAVLQEHRLSARRVRLHHPDVLRDRRHQQRGEPDRRARWAWRSCRA